MAEEQNELEGVPEPGDLVVGKYRVDRVLGIGGMGCVVAATHTTLDQPVAIKFLLNKAARNPKNVMRFQREAQAAARIKSDHVAKVSDVGTLDNGTPYMVMEFLDGEDLSERLQRLGRVAADEAVRYVLQACEALAEAHKAGIIHRDLKPANLFVATAADGTVRVKVLDFGISKIVDGGKEDLTKTSALMGSPLYMSPEQMMSAKAADGRADIWALGCILFELVSGQPPFIGNTLPEICSRILTAPPTKLSTLVPIHPDLEAIIERILEKNPDRRHQNLAELAHALYPFGGEQAARSAAIVCRTLETPQLAPNSHELPSSMSDGTGQHPAHGRSFATSQPQGSTSPPGHAQASSHAAGSHAAPGPPHGASQSYPRHGPQHDPGGASQSYPQGYAHGASQSYPQGYPPGDPRGAAQAFPITTPHGTPSAIAPPPHGATTSQNQALARETAPSPGLTPAIAATGASASGGSLSGMTPAMLQGASTAAPVAQTMSDDYPRKRRAPIFIGLGVVAAVAVAGAVALGMSGETEPLADDAPKPRPANTEGAKKDLDLTAAGTQAPPSPSPDADPAPSASERAPEPEPPAPLQPNTTYRPTPTPSPGSKPAPVAPEPTPAPAPAPSPTPPTPKIKPGDDAF